MGSSGEPCTVERDGGQLPVRSRESQIAARRRYNQRIRADRRRLGLTARGTPPVLPHHPCRIAALRKDREPESIEARKHLYKLKHPARVTVNRTDEEMDRLAATWLKSKESR